jgi:hypothetical protein
VLHDLSYVPLDVECLKNRAVSNGPLPHTCRHERGERSVHRLQRTYFACNLVDFGQGTLPDIGTLGLRCGP